MILNVAMTDLDPALRRVVVEVTSNELPNLLGHLSTYAATHDDLHLDIGAADPTHSVPSIVVEPVLPDFSALFPDRPKLAQHIASTLPRTAGDFGGKEHFWAWGLNATDPIPKYKTGRLFSELAFPIEGAVWGSNNERKTARKVLGSEVGIVTASRRAIGIKRPPGVKFSSGGHNTSIGEKLHIGNDEKLARKARRDTVIQVRSVVAVGQSPALQERILSPDSQETLAGILPQLLLLPE